LILSHALTLLLVGDLQKKHHEPQTDGATQAHICFNQKVVEGLPLKLHSEEVQTRRFRPVSPVKALSQFLSSSGKDLSSSLKQRPAGPFDSPIALPPRQTPSRSNSHRRPSDEVNSKASVISSCTVDTRDSLAYLEATYMAYIVSLRSRSGNVVGKVLRNRAFADELLVNELYNTLVEDPSKVQAAAEVSVDVLFAAFEKFLNKAWKERMGPVLSAQTLQNMELLLSSSRNNQTTERFKILLGEMTPQNRRAFTATIKVLADLLDGSGNDGDRGALIATFAEALVIEGNPHSYVTLLDHLVEDFDTLFDDSFGTDSNVFVSEADSLKRTRSVNTGSLSSNASSIRKRFGFGTLSRENSKSESESKVGQVWRALSKKTPAETDSQPPSLSKSFLSRSRSTDSDNRKPHSRPVSQDGPKTPNYSLEESRSRPGSAHNTLSSLTTIGEAASEPFTPVMKKKRRSSLSDLLSLQGSGATSFNSPGQLRAFKMPEDSVKPFQTARSPGRTPSTPKSRIPLSPNYNSPTRMGSPDRKENSPSPLRPTLTERAVNRRADDVVIANLSPGKRDFGQTGIPTIKRGLQERPEVTNNPNLSPTKLSKPPPKLRVQSPQKLRERLQNEKKRAEESTPGLQAELAKIGEELNALNLSRNAPPSLTSEVKGLSTRLAGLEIKISNMVSALNTRSASIQADLESSLVVHERKAKSLDELYREANAENEALYERFNEELSKVLRSVKGGNGVDEMRAKMKEAQDDAARLKKENQRLKRENLGLRAQLKGD
jgi:hypothetical protein